MPSKKSIFANAGLYTGTSESAFHGVAETRAKYKLFPYTERHLHCAWYDPTLRPAELHTQDGERVIVEDPGVWNLEAGPDFIGAALRIGPDQRRIQGNVEIHISPADWKNHGHTDDPRYKSVKAHVTYFPGKLPTAELPTGAVQLSLKDALMRDTHFSFENIDTTAYPFAPRATIPPCRKLLTPQIPEEKTALLRAAGEERIRRKTERLSFAIVEKGPDQIVYRELLSGLGYKNNKAPFLKLAELISYETLREEAGQDQLAAYALLLGISGLLPDTLQASWDDETKHFIRRLWDIWWKRKSRFPRTLNKKAWRLAGLRPTNHPIRRMMAAAMWFTDSKQPSEIFIGVAQENAVERATEFLQTSKPSYWDHRLRLSGDVTQEKIALIGPDRAGALIANVFIPFWAAMGEHKPFENDLLGQLSLEDNNTLVRQTAFNLFGPDHSRSLYATGINQQGLIQIFHDYCLNDRSRCATCSLPALLQKNNPH